MLIDVCISVRSACLRPTFGPQDGAIEGGTFWQVTAPPLCLNLQLLPCIKRLCLRPSLSPYLHNSRLTGTCVGVMVGSVSLRSSLWLCQIRPKSKCSPPGHVAI